MTFRDVQALATAAGLTMSRDPETLHIRLRYRARPRGPRWIVETLPEALLVIEQRGRSASKTA